MVTTGEDLLLKSIRTVPFSGAKEYWFKWKTKFMAAATVRKYYSMLIGDITIPKECTTDPKEIEMLDKESLGYLDLINSMECDLCLNLIIKGGNITDSWSAMNKKYKAKTM